MEILRKPQIGVMGSAADLSYSKDLEQIAEETGLLIAQTGATLVFGTKETFRAFGPVSECLVIPSGSLARAVRRGAEGGGGRTIGEDIDKGLFVLFSRSCDAIIAINNPLIVITPSKDNWMELEINYVKTAWEAVDIAMGKIMARRKTS